MRISSETLERQFVCVGLSSYFPYHKHFSYKYL